MTLSMEELNQIILGLKAVESDLPYCKRMVHRSDIVFLLKQYTDYKGGA